MSKQSNAKPPKTVAKPAGGFVKSGGKGGMKKGKGY